MGGRDTVGVLEIGVLAVVCCAGLPVVLAFAGGLTVVGLLGGGLAAAGVGCAAMVVGRARGRRDSAGRSSRSAGGV
jgi:hypothetical protein